MAGRKAVLEQDVRPFRIDAHFYSGGLRIHPFDSAADLWVPAQPDRFVGFRDEFQLAAGDAAVEFVRLLYNRRKITWIGIYHKSVDEKFGNRGNHAGLGVWLLNHFACEPILLLEALDHITRTLAARGIDAIGNEVHALQSDEYLPKYIAPLGDLTPDLSGWPYSAEPVAGTALLVARRTAGSNAWRDVADQILRMTVIPPQEPTQSRAVIFIPGGENMQTYADLPRAKGGFAAELVAKLPAALQSVSSDYHAMQARVAAADRSVESLQSQIEDGRSHLTQMGERIRELEGQVAASDLLKRLTSIDNKLDDVSRANATNRSLEPVLNEIRKLRAVAPATWGGGQGDSIEERSSGTGRMKLPISSISASGGLFWKVPGAVVVVIAVVLTLLWLGGRFDDGSETPSDNMSIVATGRDSGTGAHTNPSEMKIADGANFECTPTAITDGDGPISCVEGHSVRLAGIVARKMDGKCGSGQPCPTALATTSRDGLAKLLGGALGESENNQVRVQGDPLKCVSQKGNLYSDATIAWCKLPGGADLSCEMINNGWASRWDKYWNDNAAPTRC